MKKLLFSAICFTLLASITLAQPGGNNPDAAHVKDNYTKYEYQIPMRDGKASLLIQPAY